MTGMDWTMVVIWVVGTSVVGIYFKRYVRSTRDYLLAGRRLRWWQIGMAQSADAVDATDFVAVTGQGFRIGLTQIGFAWWGMGIGSILLSRYIAPLLYRSGVYTNAEYLELRYTASLRIVSAILQALYRFVAMGLVVYAMATMFNVIVGIELWNGVWAAMALTLLYVFTSGQLGVVMAAIPQVGLMLVISVLILVSAFVEIGGWRGFSEHAPDLGNLLHLAGHTESEVPGGVYLWGLILTLVTYPIVNQTVAQRIVGARSELDARKGTLISLLPWCVITGASTLVGIMALVILPELGSIDPDRIFPLYMQRYLGPGLLGLGVAALMVASMSTGAGIGTALAGLMTVDIFRGLHRQGTTDRFHLGLTRLCASLAIVCGTVFAMFIPKFGGMIPFYVAFTGTFFLPLIVPYVGGALYPKASRGSGIAALGGGVALGSVLFFGGQFLPVFLSHAQWRPFWVLGFSFLVFFAWSLVENAVRGPISRTEFASRLNAFDLGRPTDSKGVKELIESRAVGKWERQKELDYSVLGTPKDCPWYSRPGTWELAVLLLLLVLMVWWW